MATYTDNYQLTKPTMAETADIRTINGNMDTIDDILHASQISLADAYDSTQTYNTDDVVMYEFLMYKCLEDNVTGTWDATKWERTVASSSGASGTEVVPNPQGTPTADLNTIGIAGDIFNIAGRGGGGGGSIYREVTLWEGSATPPSDIYGIDLTLSESLTNYDFVAIYAIGGANGAIVYPTSFLTDGTEKIGALYTSGNANIWIILVNDTTLNVKRVVSAVAVTYTKIVGIRIGNSTISPQIYSLEEREVGVWVDNKPLYAKTFDKRNVAIRNNAWNQDVLSTADSGISIKGYEGYFNILTAEALFPYTYYRGSSEYFTTYASKDTLDIRPNMNAGNTVYVGMVTILYTKDSDVAGSGSYNTLGVPMVHIEDGVEQIIGTYNGETLYRKRYKFTNPSAGDQIHPYNITGNIKEIVNFYGVWHRDMTSTGNGLWTYQVNTENEIGVQDQFRVLARPRKENGVEGIYTYYPTSGAYSGAVADICISIEYTKFST